MAFNGQSFDITDAVTLFDIPDGAPGAPGAPGDPGDNGSNAFVGGVTLSDSPSFKQLVAGWPINQSCAAIVRFTDGTTSVTGIYTVTVNNMGVLSGVESTAFTDPSISSVITTQDDSISIVWTHTSGATVTQIFSSIALAPRTAEIDIFFTIPQATAPATPTITSYNFDTGTSAGLTTGWQTAPVQVDITSTSDLYWTQRITVSEVAYGGTQTINIVGTPIASINFGNNIQSDNFVTGISGWQIERDSGDAEFSNVDIRGASTVDSSTIGGQAFLTWNLESSDGTLNGQLSGSSTTGPGAQSVTPAQEFARYAVTEAGTYVLSSGGFPIFLRLTSGVNATANSDFIGQGPLTITITRNVLNANGIVLSFSTQTFTRNLSDFADVGPTGSRGRSLSFSEFNDIVVGPGGATVQLLATINVPTSANWGVVLLAATSLIAGTLIDKPSTASAYLISGDADRYAAEIIGGLGLLIHPQVLFVGSETSVGSFGAARLEDETYYVQISWNDTRNVGTNVSLNQTTVICTKPNESTIDASEPNDTTLNYTRLADVYANRPIDSGSTPRYVGSISITSSGASMRLTTAGQHADISNAAIRRIERKFR